MERDWSRSELVDLLSTADAGGDCWGYCARCGSEIYPVEPDAIRAWCERCGEEVNVEGPGLMGYS